MEQALKVASDRGKPLSERAEEIAFLGGKVELLGALLMGGLDRTARTLLGLSEPEGPQRGVGYMRLEKEPGDA